MAQHKNITPFVKSLDVDGPEVELSTKATKEISQIVKRLLTDKTLKEIRALSAGVLDAMINTDDWTSAEWLVRTEIAGYLTSEFRVQVAKKLKLNYDEVTEADSNYVTDEI